MKRFLKYISALCVCAFLLGTAAVFASAASVKYTAGSVSGSQGSTVTVNVTLSGGVELWGSSVSLSYNSSELQYVSSSRGALVSTGSLNHSGSKVSFAGMLNTASAKKGGTVFSVKFKILKSSGSSTLTVTPGTGKDNCDYDGYAVSATGVSGKVTVTVPVTGITLNKSSATLKKGETVRLSATVSPSNATNKSVTYSTSNSKVATVSSSGLVTAKGGGTATITAKSGSKTATFKVTVTVAQTGLAASSSTSQIIELGASKRLYVSKVPSDATDSHTVSWTSADTSVATVSSNGTVTGKALGQTTVTAKANNWTVTFKITVAEDVPESSTGEETSAGETDPLESLTDDISSEFTEPSSQNGEMSVSGSETLPAQEGKSLFERVRQYINNIMNDESLKVSRFYCYGMMFVVFVITAAVCIPITAVITKSCCKKKKDEDISRN